MQPCSQKSVPGFLQSCFPKGPGREAWKPLCKRREALSLKVKTCSLADPCSSEDRWCERVRWEYNHCFAFLEGFYGTWLWRGARMVLNGHLGSLCSLMGYKGLPECLSPEDGCTEGLLLVASEEGGWVVNWFPCKNSGKWLAGEEVLCILSKFVSGFSALLLGKRGHSSNVLPWYCQGKAVEEGFQTFKKCFQANDVQFSWDAPLKQYLFIPSY